MNSSEPFPVRNTGDVSTSGSIWNWAQNATVGSTEQLKRPLDENELRCVIANYEGKIRVVGSKLSPGRMIDVRDAESALLLDLSALRGLYDLSADRATFGAGTSLREIYQVLAKVNRMLGCSPGVIDVQTLAGAIATGTHGQGLMQSSISDECLMIRMVLGDGSVKECRREDPEFPAVQVSLGVLGVVTAVTLRTVPFKVYSCAKDAVDASTLEKCFLNWNHQFIFSKAWWFIDDNRVHVWSANEASEKETEEWQNSGRVILERAGSRSELNRTIDQTIEVMHQDTQVRGLGGKQFNTLTRFRNFRDVTGDVYQIFCKGIAVPQINIEVGVPLSRAPQIITKFKVWYNEVRPHMHYPIILRCTGPSSAWLSPAYGEATCFFGFVVYYADDGSLNVPGLRFLEYAERMLIEEGGRPHWGKYYNADTYDWKSLYPKWSSFCELRQRLDPTDKFLNSYLTKLFHRGEQ